MMFDANKIKDKVEEIKGGKSGAKSENSLSARIDAELSKIKRRVEDLEDAKSLALPITQLTPGSNLEDVKKIVNYIINYINIGVKND